MTTNYNGETPYYREKRIQGEQYQDFVMEHLRGIGFILQNYSSKQFQYKNGENPIGWEIKYDGNFRKTNNLYIETHEKANPNNRVFAQSGIYRKNAWLLLIGDYETIYTFSIRQLLEVYENEKLRNKYHIGRTQIPTSIAMLLPRDSIIFKRLLLYQHDFNSGYLFNKDVMLSTYKPV